MKRFSVFRDCATLMHDGVIAIVNAEILLVKRIAKNIAEQEISIVVRPNELRIWSAKKTEASENIASQGN